MLGEIQKRQKLPIVFNAQFGTKLLSLVCFLVFKQDVSCGVHLYHVSCILGFSALSALFSIL